MLSYVRAEGHLMLQVCYIRPSDNLEIWSFWMALPQELGLLLVRLFKFKIPTALPNRLWSKGYFTILQYLCSRKSCLKFLQDILQRLLLQYRENLSVWLQELDIL